MIALNVKYICLVSKDVVHIESIFGETVVLYNITKRYREVTNINAMKKLYTLLAEYKHE